MRRPLLRTALLVALALAVLPGAARASQQFGDTDVRDVTLRVNARGEALDSYTRSSGARRHVLVWGAVNAHAPDPDRPQVRFSYDYSGGLRRYGAAVWKRFRDACRPYDGPRLELLVAACKAPDGSYWALQRWQRLLPMRGFDPWLPAQRAWELHASHWTGPLPLLEGSPNWTYGGSWQGVFGRLTYRGEPVHGFRTPSSSRSDPYARFVYIDTFNSTYGPGWRHDTAIVTHSRNGAFCYSFVPQAPPAGSPSSAPRGPGNGERHRITVMGPGVTPVVRWEGRGLGRYDRAEDAGFNALFDRLVGRDDRVCANER
jgi:hypothetical protein